LKGKNKRQNEEEKMATQSQTGGVTGANLDSKAEQMSV
jgi:hypothetical protein